jgi:hypothetical protein
MPFVRGRYHINPIAGEALEAAREAEAALLALQHAAHSRDEAGAADDSPGSPHPSALAAAKGPVHRVEIEAAEFVPSHTGRATRGFVARVHRVLLPGPGHIANGNPAAHPDDQADGFAEPSASASIASHPAVGSRPPGIDYLSRINGSRTSAAATSAAPPSQFPSAHTVAAAPESHVFADHRDLVNFLHDLFSHD